MRSFAGALFVAEITGNELAAHRESRVSGKNHVRQFRLRLNQFDFGLEL